MLFLLIMLIPLNCGFEDKLLIIKLVSTLILKLWTKPILLKNNLNHQFAKLPLKPTPGIPLNPGHRRRDRKWRS